MRAPGSPTLSGRVPLPGESSPGKALKKASRRPTGYWQEFNQWYRDELARGARPSVSVVDSWYQANAARVWPDETDRPTNKDTRLHAKSLRSTDEVKLYFQRYRAGKKEKPTNGSLTKRASAPSPAARVMKEQFHDRDREASLAALLNAHNSSLANMAATPGPEGLLRTSAPRTTNPANNKACFPANDRVHSYPHGSLFPTSSNARCLGHQMMDAPCPTANVASIERSRSQQGIYRDQAAYSAHQFRSSNGLPFERNGQPNPHPFGTANSLMNVFDELSSPMDEDVTWPGAQPQVRSSCPGNAGAYYEPMLAQALPSPGSPCNAPNSFHATYAGPAITAGPANTAPQHHMGHYQPQPHMMTPSLQNPTIKCESPHSSDLPNQDGDNNQQAAVPLLGVDNSMRLGNMGNANNSPLVPADSGEKVLPQLDTLLAANKPSGGSQVPASAPQQATDPSPDFSNAPSWLPSLNLPNFCHASWLSGHAAGGSSTRDAAMAAVPGTQQADADPAAGRSPSPELTTRRSAPQRRLYYEHLFKESSEPAVLNREALGKTLPLGMTHTSVPFHREVTTSLPMTLSAPMKGINQGMLPNMPHYNEQQDPSSARMTAPVSPFSSLTTLGRLTEQLKPPGATAGEAAPWAPTLPKLSALLEERSHSCEPQPMMNHTHTPGAAAPMPWLELQGTMNRSVSFPQSNPRKRRSEQMMVNAGSSQLLGGPQYHEDSLNLLQLQETLPDWPELHLPPSDAVGQHERSWSLQTQQMSYHLSGAVGEMRHTSSPGCLAPTSHSPIMNYSPAELNRSSGPDRVPSQLPIMSHSPAMQERPSALNRMPSSNSPIMGYNPAEVDRSSGPHGMHSSQSPVMSHSPAMQERSSAPNRMPSSNSPIMGYNPAEVERSSAPHRMPSSHFPIMGYNPSGVDQSSAPDKMHSSQYPSMSYHPAGLDRSVTSHRLQQQGLPPCMSGAAEGPPELSSIRCFSNG